MVRRYLTLSLTICAALGLPMGPAAAQQTGGILQKPLLADRVRNIKRMKLVGHIGPSDQ